MLIRNMENAAEEYTHMSTAGLNKLLKEGYLPDGIEYYPKVKIEDDATQFGRATKEKVTKKRDPKKGDDAGLGTRAPFFVMLGDLVDLSEETKGDRWGYKFILTLM